jgi:methionyl aminopeptidase
MKLQSNSNQLLNSFVFLQHADWLHKQRVAGQCLAEVMNILQQLVANKTTLTGLEIDKIVDDEIVKRGCTPTFKHFKGFPNALCLSVNKQLVHGIPSDKRFAGGDVISFDFGATFEGAIADSAITVVYGEPIRREHTLLIETTRDCLYNAIKAMAVGKRLGVIGNAIYKTARNAGFGVVNKFGGHGIGWNKPHADIFVPNKSIPEEGIVIQPGLTIAIEPLLVPGNCSTTNTRIGEDGWTISTDDIGYHSEHSLYVHPDHVEIISWRPEEEQFIPRLVYFK